MKRSLTDEPLTVSKYEPGAFGALSGWVRALPLLGGAPVLERPRPRPM